MHISSDALWTRNFVLITLINLLLFTGFQMYPAALPPYAQGLGASDAILGWLTGVATLATLIARPITGIVLDKAGRRGFFLFGLLVMFGTSVCLLFLPFVGAVLFLRFIFGLGWGVASTATNTIAADYIPKPRFGEGMGWFSLSASMGMAVGPALALSLPPTPMFLTSASFVALALILALTLRYAPPTPRPAGTRFAPYEKAALLPAMVMFLVNITYGAMITFMAVYAAERGITNIGAYFTVYALTMILTRPFIGKILDRKGLHVLILPGLTLLITALLLLSRADSLPLFLLCGALYGLGQGCSHNSTQTMALLFSPPNRVGAANATFFTGFDGGMGVGAVLAGFLVHFAGYSAMFALLAIFPLLAGIIFVLVVRNMVKKALSTS